MIVFNIRSLQFFPKHYKSRLIRTRCLTCFALFQRQTDPRGHLVRSSMASGFGPTNRAALQPQGLDQPEPVRDRQRRIETNFFRFLPIRRRRSRSRIRISVDPVWRRRNVSLDDRRPRQGRCSGPDLQPETGWDDPYSAGSGVLLQSVFGRHRSVNFDGSQ